MTELRKLMIRDCYSEVRSIRKLVLMLQDDLGDLSIAKHDCSEELGQASDKLCEFEAWLHGLQARLGDLSNE